MLPWLTNFFLKTWGQNPRAFQTEAFQALIGKPRDHQVVNITPAAGKTRLGVTIGKWRLETGKQKKIVVVSPTTEVQMAWKEEYAKCGIQLATNFKKDDPFDNSFDGVSVTYPSVWYSPEWYRVTFPGNACAQFDEPHHLGDKTDWGESVFRAFNLPGNYTLGLSGTLWRPKPTERIPFTTLDEEGYIFADFSYGYAQALADGIVRSISFPTWNAIDGKVRYMIKGIEYIGSFNPKASEDELARTLRACNNPEFPFLRSMVEAAHAQLMSPLLRGGNDPSAGGIFFGETIEHLDYIQREVFNKLKIKSKVVHSGDDCDDPKGEIKEFRNNHKWEWILCAKMISEGVSINRLRVAVLASSIMSELAFRQMSGRILRVIGSEDREAFQFMPRHPKYVEYAEKYEEEKRQALIIQAENESRGEKSRITNSPSSQITLDAQGEESIHVVGRESLESNAIEYARSKIREANMETVISAAAAAKLFSVAGLSMVHQPTIEKPTPIFDLEAEKDRLSNSISRLVKKATGLTVGPDNGEEFQEELKRIYNEILSPLDRVYKNQRQVCTIDQLKVRYNRMVDYLKELTR